MSSNPNSRDYNSAPPLAFVRQSATRICPLCAGTHIECRVKARHQFKPDATVDYFHCSDCLCLFTDKTDNAYAPDNVDRMPFGFYFQIGAGVEPMARMIADNIPSPFRSFADIGCGAGISLDFIRKVYEIDGLGFEPNRHPVAEYLDGEILPVALDKAWLDRDPRRFDMILACEVIEHVADPLMFAQDIRGALASETSVFVCSTPDAAFITPKQKPTDVYSKLFPGEHHILFSEQALKTLLYRAGFVSVEIRSLDGQLNAVAGLSETLRKTVQSPRVPPTDVYRLYLEKSWVQLSSKSASPFYAGQAFRLFKAQVNSGNAPGAYTTLRNSKPLYGLVDGEDIVSEQVVSTALALTSMPAYLSRLPGFCGSFAYHAAMLARIDGRVEQAETGLWRAMRILRHEATIAPFFFLESNSLLAPCLTETALTKARLEKNLEALHNWRAALEVFEIPRESFLRTGVRLAMELNAHGAYAQVTEIIDAIDSSPAADSPLTVALQTGDAQGCDDGIATLTFDLWVCRFYLALNHQADLPLAHDAQIALSRISEARPKLEKEEVLAVVRGDLVARRLPNGYGKPQDKPTVHFIDQLWCDIHGVFVKGWVHAYDSEISKITLRCDGHNETALLHSRPDVVKFYPEYPRSGDYGFSVYLACPPFQPVFLDVTTTSEVFSLEIELPGHLVDSRICQDAVSGEDIFKEQMKLRRGKVLVLGGRLGETNPDRWADCLLPECEVISVDIHPGPGVDVVADAHRLSRYFASGAIDGVISTAVLEHLQMPWLVAAEINKVLKVGGLTLHRVPQTWPVHAAPNDFWRMSSDGLQTLFGFETGFEILNIGMSLPIRMYPPPQIRNNHYPSIEMPLFDGFMMSSILSKKIADLPAGTVVWPTTEDEIRKRAEQYPAGI